MAPPCEGLRLAYCTAHPGCWWQDMAIGDDDDYADPEGGHCRTRPPHWNFVPVAVSLSSVGLGGGVPESAASTNTADTCTRPLALRPSASKHHSAAVRRYLEAASGLTANTQQGFLRGRSGTMGSFRANQGTTTTATSVSVGSQHLSAPPGHGTYQLPTNAATAATTISGSQHLPRLQVSNAIQASSSEQAFSETLSEQAHAAAAHNDN